MQARAAGPTRRESDAEGDGARNKDDRDGSFHASLLRRELELKGFDAAGRILGAAQAHPSMASTTDT